MSRETTYAGMVGDWRKLLASLDLNDGELAHLEPFRTQLAAQLDQAITIGRQQAALTASKQDATQQLQTTMVEGQRLATLLRSAIRQHYGIRAERVAEFGIQPFRGRKSKPTPEDPTLPPPNGE